MSNAKPTLVSPAPVKPIEAEEFAGLMRAAGVPAGASLAVAVSGGPDSMALALLAGDWAAEAGQKGGKAGSGDIHFLTFDHGLRRESADEARQAGAWLAARGLTHHIFSWPEDLPKPASDVQGAARKARYEALEGWCRAHDVKFLLLGHHLEDQAETLLMRLARGSGIDGLSAMAVSAPPVTGQGIAGQEQTPRLLRPLLGTPKARLVATLTARDQQWIEDPSNSDRSYLRVQARELLRDMPLDGLTPERLAATARRMARVREVLDDQTSRLLDASVTLSEEGYARLDPALLIDPDTYEEISLRVLSRLAASIGGRAYPPRLEGVERLLVDMKSGDFTGATLAGCLFAPFEAGKNLLLVAREAGTTDARQDITPGETVHWDGRFAMALDGGTGGQIAALGEAGWRELLELSPDARKPDARKTPFPHAVRLALPTLRVGGKIRAVPHLGYAAAGFAGFTARFSPLRALYPRRPEGGG